MINYETVRNMMLFWILKENKRRKKSCVFIRPAVGQRYTT